MNVVYRSLAALLLFGWASVGFAQGQEVSDGDVLTLTIPNVDANSAVVSQDFFIDLPADARALEIQLNTTSNRDIDILATAGVPIDRNASNLFDAADFSSGGAAGDEFVFIADYSTSALAGQRWFFNMFSFPGTGGSATLEVTVHTDPPPNVAITVDFANALGEDNCDVAPWNDSTARSPQGGNNGTTLGELRRNAVNEAMRIISQDLFSYVPIRVRACWENLGEAEDGNGATLASAGPRTLAVNTNAVPLADHWYAIAPAARMAGTTPCKLGLASSCDSHELLIRFNTDIDTDAALGSRSYYYGFEDQTGINPDVDFLSVALHELTHALGYLSVLDEDGSRLESNGGSAFDDAFSRQLVDARGDTPVEILSGDYTDADRVAVFTSGNDLQWQGHEAYSSGDNVLSNVDFSLLRMHAPSEYNPGSSVSHIGAAHCDLMNANISVCADGPHRELDLAKPILHSVGWAPALDQPSALGLMFDPGRSGHGFEFQKGGVSNGEVLYVLTFYSYDNTGRPEWYQAVGPIRNGVFSPRRDELNNTMYELFYLQNDAGNGFSDRGRTTPHRGHAMLSFNDADQHPACNDGVDRTGPKAVFGWITDNSADSWCVVPLISRDQRTETDFTGLWDAGDDDGFWGFSLEDVARTDGTTDIFLLLYIYDDDGRVAWYQGFADEIELGTPKTFDLEQIDGFGRTRPVVETEKTVAGSMTLTLVSPDFDINAGNRMSVNVEFQNSPGGVWTRDDVPVRRFTLPRDD